MLKMLNIMSTLLEFYNYKLKIQKKQLAGIQDVITATFEKDIHILFAHLHLHC
jgi:hypothetical protein